jgi:hypothetical protein
MRHEDPLINALHFILMHTYVHRDWEVRSAFAITLHISLIFHLKS